MLSKCLQRSSSSPSQFLQWLKKNLSSNSSFPKLNILMWYQASASYAENILSDCGFLGYIIKIMSASSSWELLIHSKEIHIILMLHIAHSKCLPMIEVNRKRQQKKSIRDNRKTARERILQISCIKSSLLSSSCSSMCLTCNTLFM